MTVLRTAGPGRAGRAAIGMPAKNIGQGCVLLEGGCRHTAVEMKVKSLWPNADWR